ncbi:glycosyl hydrolase [Sphaerochaeta sp. PS]|uniref:glycosyl hydrolase n=1 Tax=Sphaerochaeta sp. PS TaxID=3076336 RepID=UPI0028A3396C|nr:glycosyl hydrolase [Sphaerochaeta sp. PS]MDT4762575.1 hypothetical protein [Sphaerochaeta sp. PS]
MLINNHPMLATSKPYARWWWFSGAIAYGQIDEQLSWFSSHGFGGVEIAWVYPYEGKRGEGPKFLDEEFQALLHYTQEGCSERGLGCDLTFGTLWPFNGTFIPKEYSSKTFDGYSTQTVDRSWEAGNTQTPAKVLDHLSKDALHWYAEHLLSHGFGEASKNSSLSFFCDSWEVEPDGLFYDGLFDDFEKRFGYSLENNIIQPPANADIRFDYRTIISDRVLSDFYKPYASMCNKAGALSRVQCHGAPTDVLAAYALVDIPESETLLFDPDFSLLAASAAAFHDKPIVSSETFSCIYGWVPTPHTPPGLADEQIRDLRCVADAQFAWGVNRVVWHGKPFSTKGDPKKFYASVHLGADGRLEKDLNEFNAYLETVSDYMSRGETYSRLAVYFPLEDQWMKDRLPEELRKPSSNFYWELQEVHMDEELLKYRPLWFSKEWLQDLVYEEPFFRYRNRRFEAILVDSEWMVLDSLRAIARLRRQGAPVIFRRWPKEPGVVKHEEYQGLLDELKQQEEIKLTSIRPILESEQPLDYWCRKDGDDYYLFIAHPRMRKLRYPLEYGYGERVEELTVKAKFYGGKEETDLKLEFKERGSLVVRMRGEVTRGGE